MTFFTQPVRQLQPHLRRFRYRTNTFRIKPAGVGGVRLGGSTDPSRPLRGRKHNLSLAISRTCSKYPTNSCRKPVTPDRTAHPYQPGTVKPYARPNRPPVSPDQTRKTTRPNRPHVPRDRRASSKSGRRVHRKTAQTARTAQTDRTGRWPFTWVA